MSGISNSVLKSTLAADGCKSAYVPIGLLIQLLIESNKANCIVICS